MGNPRSFTRNFNACVHELEAFLRAKKVRSLGARREAMNKAASGRPADLAEQARAALAERRSKLTASKQADTSPEMRRVLAKLAGRQI